MPHLLLAPEWAKTVVLGRAAPIPPLDLLGQIMAALHRPVARYQNMQRNKSTLAGCARPQGVKVDSSMPDSARAPRRCAPDPLAAAPCPGHHTPCCAAAENSIQTMFVATSSAISGSRISQPVSCTSTIPTTTRTENPDIGQQVVRVGGQPDRTQPPSGAQQNQRYRAVDRGGRERDRQPKPNSARAAAGAAAAPRPSGRSPRQPTRISILSTALAKYSALVCP